MADYKDTRIGIVFDDGNLKKEEHELLSNYRVFCITDTHKIAVMFPHADKSKGNLTLNFPRELWVKLANEIISSNEEWPKD